MRLVRLKWEVDGGVFELEVDWDDPMQPRVWRYEAPPELRREIKRWWADLREWGHPTYPEYSAALEYALAHKARWLEGDAGLAELTRKAPAAYRLQRLIEGNPID